MAEANYLIAHKVLASHRLSRLLSPEKHHLGLRPRGRSYALLIYPTQRL